MGCQIAFDFGAGDGGGPDGSVERENERLFKRTSHQFNCRLIASKSFLHFHQICRLILFHLIAQPLCLPADASVSLMSAGYDRLHDQMNVFNVGINWLLKGHNSKITFDYQNRPLFNTNASGNIVKTSSRDQFVLQYQIAF